MEFISTIDEGFIRKNFKDATEAEKFITSNRKRAIVTTIVLGIFLVVLVIAISYAMIKIGRTQNEVEAVNALSAQVETCVATTQQQQSEAALAKSRAEEQNRTMLLQIQECNQQLK